MKAKKSPLQKDTDTHFDSSLISEEMHYFQNIESETNERKAFENQYQLNKQRLKEESQRKFQEQQRLKEIEKERLKDRLREIDELTQLDSEQV